MLPTPSSPFGGMAFVAVTPITPAAAAPAAAAAALGSMSVMLYPEGLRGLQTALAAISVDSLDSSLTRRSLDQAIADLTVASLVNRPLQLNDGILVNTTPLMSTARGHRSN